jgi:hypothetical protein
MRELGAGDVNDMIQQKMMEGTPSNPIEVMMKIIENAMRHIQQKLRS